MKKFYLRDDIIFEPTVASWYAWIQLLAPHTASLNLLNRYIPIIKSFIEFPELHAQAATDSKLFSGPYSELPQSSKQQVERYLENITNKTKSLVELATEIVELNNKIFRFEGQPFDALYDQLSSNLKNSVELVYNESNRPSIRYLEPVLYQRYSEIMQKIQSTHVYSNPFKRKFVLSTPRLSAIDQTLEIQIPFKSEVYDQLFQSSQVPTTITKLAEQLELPSSKYSLFTTMFTSQKTNKKHHPKNKLSIKYFGHACLLIEFNSKTILVDPLIHPSPMDNLQNNIFTYDDLPEIIDYVLISHAHHDHFNPETLLKLRYKIKKIIIPNNNNGSILDPSLKLALIELGFKNIVTLDEFESIHDKNITIRSLPFWGEHADYNIRSKAIYHLALGKNNIIIATDMNYLNDFPYLNYINAKYIDAVFIGTEFVGASANWLYGPLISNETTHNNKIMRRLNSSNAERAYQFARSLNAKRVYIYALGQEPWLSYVMGMKHNPDSLQSKEAEKLAHILNQNGIYTKKLYGCDDLKL